MSTGEKIELAGLLLMLASSCVFIVGGIICSAQERRRTRFLSNPLNRRISLW